MKTDLEDIKRVTEYKDFGHYLMVRCPFHNDLNPSLMVSEKRYVCFTCDEKGSLEVLYATLTGTSLEKKKLPASGYGGIFPVYDSDELDPLDEFCYDAHNRLLRNNSYQIYLKRRGLEPAIKPYDLGFSGGWYTIPIYNKRGEIQGAMARAGKVVQDAINKRFTLPKGQPPMLYVPDWKLVKESDRLYVTFGPIDALSLSLLGLASASPSSGKDAFDVSWLDDIRKTIFFVPDDGEYETAMKYAMKLGWRGKIIRLPYPEGMKDPNDFLKSGKEDELREYLIQAK